VQGESRPSSSKDSFQKKKFEGFEEEEDVD
jgi:hypothetical protein